MHTKPPASAIVDADGQPGRPHGEAHADGSNGCHDDAARGEQRCGWAWSWVVEERGQRHDACTGDEQGGHQPRHGRPWPARWPGVRRGCRRRPLHAVTIRCASLESTVTARRSDTLAEMGNPTRTVARAIVGCLEKEGVELVFGLPGEENLHTIDALADSSIRFITTRDERGAAFMADTYGALTGKPGVCLATLGPGAINLMLGVANAQLDSHPLVALTAQASLDRIYKESHQFVDLVSLFRPITKWGDMVTVRGAAPEMVRKAFKQAKTERPGATFLVLPEDVAERMTDAPAAAR